MKTLIVFLALLLGSGTLFGSSSPHTEIGKASWYSTKCNGGTRTASGQKLSNTALTAAHKTLPMGTKVKVTNLNNGKIANLIINDRGPYLRGRVIDVTVAVAKKLNFIESGITRVKIEVVGQIKL